MDLQGDTAQEKKDKAKEVTSMITGRNKDDDEDVDDQNEEEGDESHEAGRGGGDEPEDGGDGARTPTSSKGKLDAAEDPTTDEVAPKPVSDAPAARQMLDSTPSVEEHSTTEGDNSKGPIQVQIEPAPVAQPVHR